jgi:hypothetical protein
MQPIASSDDQVVISSGTPCRFEAYRPYEARRAARAAVADRLRGSGRASAARACEAPAGYSAKVLWAFLAPSVRNGGDGKLVIRGENLTGPGRIRDEFSEISYSGQDGAPSFASILDLPRSGCWRLRLTTGELRSFVDIEAISEW